MIEWLGINFPQASWRELENEFETGQFQYLPNSFELDWQFEYVEDLGNVSTASEIVGPQVCESDNGAS